MSCQTCSKVQNGNQSGNQNNMAIWGIGGLLALLGIIILNKKQ